MSGDAKVDLEWADGTYSFRLPIGQVRELQEKTNAGPAEILTRLHTNTWRIDDIHETIRLGLIGGGTTPDAARTLCHRYVANRPYAENVPVALAILGAALFGVPDDPVGKAEGEKPSPDGSDSPSFTEQEPSLGSAPSKSMQ